MTSHRSQASDLPTTQTEVVANLADLEVDSMHLARVGERRIVVIRTPSGVHALDNACPYQGYGLTTGALTINEQGERLVTCLWHNWKFKADDGSYVMGEEDVACHQVDVNNRGEVAVTVTEPTDAQERERLWPSLKRGVESDYVGQVARDTVRLLAHGADPTDIMWTAMPRAGAANEWGLGLDLALAADCLEIAHRWRGSDRALPLVQGLAGISESTRGVLMRPVPAAAAVDDFVDAIEREDVDSAMAGVMADLERGTDQAEVRAMFIEACSRHHLDYGHGAIYTQKTFELLDRGGWHRAGDLLPHLALTIGWGTREDTLPYMRSVSRKIDVLDLVGLAELAQEAEAVRGETLSTLPPRPNYRCTPCSTPPRRQSKRQRRSFAPEGSKGCSTLSRLLCRIGYSDTTQRSTSAKNRIRNDSPGSTSHMGSPTPELLDGRGNNTRVRRRCASHSSPSGSSTTQGGPSVVLGSPTRYHHLVKLTEAARGEAHAFGSRLPLSAAARFVHAPRRERFVASTVHASVNFVDSGRPPAR